MKVSSLLIMIMIIVFGLMSIVKAQDMADINITVLLGEDDVSLEAQVMLLKGAVPIILASGQEKSLKVAAGTYEITALLPQGGKSVLPAGGKVEVEAGEENNITLKLQDMSGIAGGQMPSMSDMMEDDKEEFDPKEATEAELREALEEEDKEVRKSAFNELYNRQKVPFLAEMLSHPQGEVRELSLEKLYNLTAEYGSPTGPIDANKTEIINCIQDPYQPARIKAIEIMGNYRKFPGEVLPILIEVLEEPEVDIRHAAVRAFGLGLGSEGKDEEEVIKALAARIEKDEEAIIRREAIQSLGYFRTTDSRVYKALAIALSDEDPKVRRTSAEVLRELGASASILNEITAALKDPDSYLRSDLLRAMQKLDSAELEGVVHPVAELLKDDRASVREQAIGVIRAAGPAGAEVLPALTKALSDTSNNVIVGAIRTLDALGPEHARNALPELLELIKGESFRSTGAVARIMVTIGDPAIPSLIELLSHNNYEVRARSASILGSFGPAAKEAVPRLTSIYQDENEHEAVRRNAYFAVTNITGEKPEL